MQSFVKQHEWVDQGLGHLTSSRMGLHSLSFFCFCAIRWACQRTWGTQLRSQLKGLCFEMCTLALLCTSLIIFVLFLYFLFFSLHFKAQSVTASEDCEMSAQLCWNIYFLRLLQAQLDKMDKWVGRWMQQLWPDNWKSILWWENSFSSVKWDHQRQLDAWHHRVTSKD